MTGRDTDRSERPGHSDVERRDVLKLLGSVPVVGGLLEAEPVRSLSTVLSKFTGSTDGTAEVSTDAEQILGFHRPQIDGIPYGHAGERLPEGRAGEWADAEANTVELRSPDAESLEARLFHKVVSGELYVGLYVPPSEAAKLESAIPELRLQVDLDGSGELSPGDLRVVASPVVSEAVGEGSTPDVLAMNFDLAVYRDGEFLDPDFDEAAVLSPSSAMAGTPPEGGVGIESRLDLLETMERLDQDVDENQEVNYDADVSFGDVQYGVGLDPREEYREYRHGGGYRPPGTPNVTIDQSSADRIEVTQSVQDENNSLPLVQEKDTLARVFVDHPREDPIQVTVTLEAYTERPGGASHWQSIGTESKSFTAPPTPLDRENFSDSANFELPFNWRSEGSLILEASVERSDAVDLGLENGKAATHVRLGDNYEPSIVTVFVNEGSFENPDFPSIADTRLVQDGFERLMPVPGVDFHPQGWNRLGVIENSDNLIAELDDLGETIRTFGTVTVDQIFGHTQHYGGGLSDPNWENQSGNCFAAWGELGSTSRELVMAHEVNHNIGGKTWAKHVAGGCGSGGGDENHTTRDVGEVGWNPAYSSMVPTNHPELMTYCTDSNPRKWVSPYRWKRLFNRWNNWTAERPTDPDYRNSSSNRLTAMADGGLLGGEAVQAPTSRVVSGFLFPDGGGELRPSFEIPGETDDPVDQTEDPDAVLEVRYGSGELRVAIDASFEPIEEEADERLDQSSFVVSVPDDGEVRALRLLGPDGEEELDSFEATGFELLDGTTVGVPEAFERDELTRIDLPVEAESETTLYKRLIYAPDDETLLPFGRTFTDDSYPVVFTRDPGGEEARFVLLVSDGVQTERVVSDAFELPSRPPEVRIDRAHRLVGEYDDDAEESIGDDAGDAPDEANLSAVRDAAGPIETVVGATVSLHARGLTERDTGIDGTGLAWTIADEAGPVDVVGTPVGERVIHRFDSPGSYAVTVEATDPETGLSASDEVGVEVADPPLPDASTVEAFGFTPTFTVTAERIVRNEPVQFDASGTEDLGGDAIALYEWDWDGDGEFEETTETPTATHAFSTGGERTVALRVTDDHGVTSDPATLSFTVRIRATIDVKPGGGERNPITLRDEASVPVAVLHTSAFDPARIDPSTVHFGDPDEVGFDGSGVPEGGATPEHSGGHESDVDDDGDVDVAFHFPVADLGFDASTTEGKLVATTTDGVPVFATDEVSIVGRGD